MVASRIRLCIFSLLVLGNLTTPRNPSILQFSLHTVSIGMSAIYFHFFRKYLNSGPPASKTVNHAMFRSLSFLAQAFVGYFYTLMLFGCVMPRYISAFIHQHPAVACVALTPRIFMVPFLVNFMIITFFKLMVVLFPQTFLELHHEKAAKYLLLSCMVFVILEQGFEIAYQGTTCNAKLATALLNFAGLKIDLENFGEEKSCLVTVLIPPVLLIIGLLNYLSAFVIQAQKKRAILSRAPQVSRIGPPVGNTEFATLWQQRRHTQVCPTSENIEQAYECQDERIQIQQLGTLNKKDLKVLFTIGFASGILLLIIMTLEIVFVFKTSNKMYQTLMVQMLICLLNSLPFLWVQCIHRARDNMDRKVKIFLGLNDDLSPLSSLAKRLCPVHVQKQLDSDAPQDKSRHPKSRRALAYLEMTPTLASTSFTQTASLDNPHLPNIIDVQPIHEGTSTTQF